MSRIDIIIPTFNLPNYLVPCVKSILENGNTENLNRIIVVNNGDKESIRHLFAHPKITVLQQEKNVGWEGGLKKGLEVSKAPFVVFMNDDTFIPRGSWGWLDTMLSRFQDLKVGAVGPCSNVVMGVQNMQVFFESSLAESPFLVGFCVMLSREALDAAGGVDDTLPNHGDDLDLSIRLRKLGLKLLIDRTVFVFHHGFKTGERVHGEYWNSMEMEDRTNHSLIRKHGLREFSAVKITPYYRGYTNGL